VSSESLKLPAVTRGLPNVRNSICASKHSPCATWVFVGIKSSRGVVLLHGGKVAVTVGVLVGLAVAVAVILAVGLDGWTALVGVRTVAGPAWPEAFACSLCDSSFLVGLGVVVAGRGVGCTVGVLVGTCGVPTVAGVAVGALLFCSLSRRVGLICLRFWANNAL